MPTPIFTFAVDGERWEFLGNCCMEQNMVGYSNGRFVGPALPLRAVYRQISSKKSWEMLRACVDHFGRIWYSLSNIHQAQITPLDSPCRKFCLDELTFHGLDRTMLEVVNAEGELEVTNRIKPEVPEKPEEPKKFQFRLLKDLPIGEHEVILAGSIGRIIGEFAEDEAWCVQFKDADVKGWADGTAAVGYPGYAPTYDLGREGMEESCGPNSYVVEELTPATEHLFEIASRYQKFVFKFDEVYKTKFNQTVDKLEAKYKRKAAKRKTAKKK